MTLPVTMVNPYQLFEKLTELSFVGQALNFKSTVQKRR